MHHPTNLANLISNKIRVSQNLDAGIPANSSSFINTGKEIVPLRTLNKQT